METIDVSEYKLPQSTVWNSKLGERLFQNDGKFILDHTALCPRQRVCSYCQSWGFTTKILCSFMIAVIAARTSASGQLFS